MTTSESSTYIPVGGKKRVYYCSYCRRDVTLKCRIRCAICQQVELCTDCFCSGIEMDTHKPSHDYQISDCLDFPVFSLEWTAQEELLLLEGIEKCGMGNWKGVSEYISSKTSKQVEDHYWDSYMGVHGRCLPSTILVEDHPVSLDDFLTSIEDVTLRGKMQNYAHTEVLKGYAYGDEVIREKGRELGKAKDKQDVKERNAALPGGDLPGFLPLREDFDVEYDNDAEMMLAEIDFAEDDHPTERALKHKMIQIFNSKMDERQLRKRFAIDRGLVDFKKHQLADKKRTKEERELAGKLRLFARFQTQEEHEALVDGVLRARKLRAQIEALQQMRRMGIVTLEQARQYETDRKRRELEMKSKRQRDQESYIFESSAKLGSSTTDNSTSGGSSRRQAPRRGVDESGSSSSRRGDRDTEGQSSMEVPSNVMSTAPGAELLSAKEMELCNALPLLPLHYLSIKEALVREAVRTGTLTQEGVRRVVHVDAPKQAQIYDFFVQDVAVNCTPIPSTSILDMLDAGNCASAFGAAGSKDLSIVGDTTSTAVIGVKSGPSKKKKT